MATKVFRGDAVAVAQVNTVTPASVTIGNIFTLTINGKSISYTAAAATVADVTAGLAAAVAASSIPEFAEVTAADNTTNLTLTASTAGRPFTQTSSSADGTGSPGHSMPTSTTTSSAGPSHYGTAANWSPSGVPVSTDDVYIRNTATSILYDLDQSAVTLNSLTIEASFTGYIGNPDYNGTYYEYREKFLKVGATTVNIGQGTGGGSGRIKLNVGAVQATFNISTTGSSAESGQPAVHLVGTHASNVLNILQGNVGVALDPGATSVIATTRIGYQNAPATDVSLTFGPGLTHGVINQSGGTITTSSNITTLNITDGVMSVLGTAAVTTINAEGGTIYHQSTGTITTANLGTGAALDFSKDIRARTVTNCTLEAQSSLKDGFKSVTFTNPIYFRKCSLAEVTLDLGSDFSLQRS